VNAEDNIFSWLVVEVELIGNIIVKLIGAELDRPASLTFLEIRSELGQIAFQNAVYFCSQH
jgi:hypothetical protein